MIFTENDQIAIDTYNDLKDQVSAFGLHNFEREERILFKKGRILLEKLRSKHLRRRPHIPTLRQSAF